VSPIYIYQDDNLFKTSYKAEFKFLYTEQTKCKSKQNNSHQLVKKIK